MASFYIREAEESDVLGMAKVRVDTWRAAYQGIIPDDILARLSYESTSENWRKGFWEERKPGVAVYVAENEGKEVVGIAICGPEESRDPIYHGEIYVLYVLPQYQNQGIGRELVSECVRHLSQHLKICTMLIWVIADSPIRRFYELLGGELVRTKKKEIGKQLICEAGYGWQEIDRLILRR